MFLEMQVLRIPAGGRGFPLVLYKLLFMKQSIFTITMALVRVIKKENYLLASLFNEVLYLYLSTQS